MKTYEFQIASHTGPVSVVVTIDDNGDFARIEYVGYNSEYDQTFVALCGKESEMSKLTEMVKFKDFEKTSMIYGTSRLWNTPETTRMILSLTISAAERLKVITIISERECRGYVRRFSDENIIQLILSLVNQDFIVIATLNDDYMTFEALVEIFECLDVLHRYKLIDGIRTTRFRVSQMVKLVANENEKTRRRMAYKIVRSIRGFLTHDDTSAVIGCVIDLAETMKNDRNRANTVVDVLVHVQGNVKPTLAKRMGKILLGIDPVVLRDLRSSIMIHYIAFEPAQYGKLLSIMR